MLCLFVLFATAGADDDADDGAAAADAQLIALSVVFTLQSLESFMTTSLISLLPMNLGETLMRLIRRVVPVIWLRNYPAVNQVVL